MCALLQLFTPSQLLTHSTQSILLIFCIDRFMQEIVVAQKEGYRQVLENTKEIHNTITNLNQQNREYYSLRFAEVQKELSGMKVELGRIE